MAKKLTNAFPAKKYRADLIEQACKEFYRIWNIRKKETKDTIERISIREQIFANDIYPFCEKHDLSMEHIIRILRFGFRFNSLKEYEESFKVIKK